MSCASSFVIMCINNLMERQCVCQIGTERARLHLPPYPHTHRHKVSSALVAVCESEHLADSCRA